MKRGKSDSLHSSHLFSCLLLSSPVLSLSVATHHTWCEGANRHPRSFRFVVHHTGGQCERELCETQRVFYLYLNRERREREEREKKKARCEEREMWGKREKRREKRNKLEEKREKRVYTHIKLELEPETYYAYIVLAKADQSWVSTYCCIPHMARP